MGKLAGKSLLSFEKYHIELIKGVLQSRFMFQCTLMTLSCLTVRHVEYLLQASLVPGHRGKIGTDILHGGCFGNTFSTDIPLVILFVCYQVDGHSKIASSSLILVYANNSRAIEITSSGFKAIIK